MKDPTEKLEEVTKGIREYSKEATKHLLHEMDNDPFILPFLPLYIVGLVSTIPGHIAEGLLKLAPRKK